MAQGPERCKYKAKNVKVPGSRGKGKKKKKMVHQTENLLWTKDKKKSWLDLLLPRDAKMTGLMVLLQRQAKILPIPVIQLFPQIKKVSKQSHQNSYNYDEVEKSLGILLKASRKTISYYQNEIHLALSSIFKSKIQAEDWSTARSQFCSWTEEEKNIKGQEYLFVVVVTQIAEWSSLARMWRRWLRPVLLFSSQHRPASSPFADLVIDETKKQGREINASKDNQRLGNWSLFCWVDVCLYSGNAYAL